MTVTIYVEDVQGRQQVQPAGQTLASTLASLRLPHTMFQAYLVRPGEELLPIPHWTTLDSIDWNRDQVLLRALRNTLFDTILPPNATGNGQVVAGAGFDQIVPSDDGTTATWKQVALVPEEAQRLVVDEVASFLRANGTDERGCVFGVSGGGDSNALAYGLSKELPQDKLYAFTLVFREVMTQAAADRATILCQDLGINHQVIQADELARILAVRTSLDALYDDFATVFGTEALHFFGTFLILKTARTLAQRHGFHDLAFGYNREDLLAELLFMVVNGRRPLNYPVRSLGEQRIVMPVWRIPKLLLDACHPRFSLENYRERDAHTTRQRSLAFYLGHTLDSSYPSFGLSLLDGMQRACGGDFAHLTYDTALDVYVTELADESRRNVVRDLLRRHLGSAGE